VLIGSLLLGLVLGLLAGGRLDNLANVRLRLVGLLFLGLMLRFGTQIAIESGVPVADAFRVPLFAAGFGALLVGLWINRERPGLPLAFVGILMNAVAVVTNGGFMPVWEPSIRAAGLPADTAISAFHKVVGLGSGDALGGIFGGQFLAQAGPLGDVIPIPIPFLRNVASVGDLFLAAGLAFFLFATAEFVARRTRNASATWWIRSPSRLISWPVHSAENEPSSARRTYGWRRTRSMSGGSAGTATRRGSSP